MTQKAESWIRHVKRLQEACRKRAFTLFIDGDRVKVADLNGEEMALNQHQQARIVTDEKYNPFHQQRKRKR